MRLFKMLMIVSMMIIIMFRNKHPLSARLFADVLPNSQNNSATLALSFPFYRSGNCGMALYVAEF